MRKLDRRYADALNGRVTLVCELHIPGNVNAADVIAHALDGPYDVVCTDEGNLKFCKSAHFWMTSNIDPFVYIRSGEVSAISRKSRDIVQAVFYLDIRFLLVMSAVSLVVILGLLLLLDARLHYYFVVMIPILILCWMPIVIALFPMKVRSAVEEEVRFLHRNKSVGWAP